MTPRGKALTDALGRVIEAASAVQMINQNRDQLEKLPLMQRVHQAEQVLQLLKQELEIAIEKELN